MQVLSPVGEFKVVRAGHELSRSEATLERGDLPYVGVAASLLFGTFYMGRQSVKIALKARELGSR